MTVPNGARGRQAAGFVAPKPLDRYLFDRIDADQQARSYRLDPVRWAKDRAKLELWSAQQAIMQSVRDNRLTCVQSCHEIGKSFIAATTACWWVDVQPIGDAFVVTTAPSDKQVRAVLWREINRLHARMELPGRTNLTEWYINGELVAFGRKPADYDPTAFQGIHALYMLVVLDEACGIPKELWDAASSLAANVNARILAIGNPDDPHSEFAENCRRDSSWNVIKIGYKQTPNFTGEKISQRLSDLLIHPSWVDDRRAKWGEGSALFSSKCEGEFPRNTENGVIPLAWADACRWVDHPEDANKVECGIDVGGGGDRTIIRERRGRKAGRTATFINPDPMQTVGQLVEKINEWGITKVKIDPIGIGWGITGRLKELSSRHSPNDPLTTHNAEVIGVNFSEASNEPDRFLNKRAEVWWNVGRELSRLKLWDLEHVDEDVMAELTVPKYEIVDSRGKIKIESKDDIRKADRLGRSPDEGDALLLAFYEVQWEATQSPMDLADINLMGNIDPGQF